ncbi:MAG: hypothetical protein WBV89_03875, partial [Ilumatobacter sp.]
MADRAAPHAGEGQRDRALAAVVMYCIRTGGLTRVLATIGIGSVPLVVSIARSTDDLGPPLTVLGIVAGASIGWIADDPSTEVLTPCPISGPRRMLIRLASAALVIAACVAGWVLIGVAAAGAPG